VVFTVIVPTHERPYLLHRALSSLVAQTFTDFQVIIVSDSGMYLPPIHDLAQLKGRVVYIQRDDGRPMGPGDSRNLALDLVRTPYVLFLDDDDSFEPGHLQAVAQALGGSSAWGQRPLVFTDFKVLEEDRNQTPPTQLKLTAFSLAGTTAEQVFVRNTIPNSCLVYRSDILKNVRFDTTMKLYEDWDFLLQVLALAPLQHAPGNGVVIHKSYVAGEANLRRGNSQDHILIESTAEIFRRHRAPSAAVAQGRTELMATAGVQWRE
jgi:glycosyltransferase involved in cell wall biosynthesis